MSDSRFRGLTRDAVAALVGPEAASRVHQIDKEEMDYGAHWSWFAGEQYYTARGLALLVERLAEHHRGEALALRARVEQARAEADRRASPAGERRPVRDRANGYQPDPLS